MGFRQDECRPGGFRVGMLSLVCSIPACPGLLVVVHFSCDPPLLLFGELLSSQDLLVVKLSPLCWLAASGEREGLFEQRALGCFRFHASLVVLRVLPGVGAGSEARGEAQVTIVFLCCDLLGSGTASPTAGAKQAAVYL